MISVCLTKFTNDPWSNVIIKEFYKTLSNKKNVCKVKEIFGYSQKKIFPFCRKLVDMGASAIYPRKKFRRYLFIFQPI